MSLSVRRTGKLGRHCTDEQNVTSGVKALEAWLEGRPSDHAFAASLGQRDAYKENGRACETFAAPERELKVFVPRSPQARWDGFFLIAIFPPTSHIRWFKFHLFVGANRPGRVPLAALEGMGGAGEIFEAVCFKDRLFFERQPASLDIVQACLDPFALCVPDRFELSGSWPAFSLTVTDAAQGLKGDFELEARDRQQWCRLGNFLSYFGLHSTLKGKLTVQGRDYPLQGLGILEHAWGTDTRIPLTRLFKGFWHWDVLWFGAPKQTHAAVAALAVAPLGVGAFPLRGGGRVPGHGFQAFRGLRVRYLETRDVAGATAPVRWEGSIQNKSGRIMYVAQAAGPVLQPFEHGVFLGFTFEGTYKSRGGSESPISGTGFTEFVDTGSYTARKAAKAGHP